MVSWKIVSVLTKSWENSPGKFDLFLWYSFSWKILCVLTKFWTRSHGKFDLFIRYFLLLENCMFSCRILRKFSWKFGCVLVHFASPGKFICVLVLFLILLENLMCSYKRIMSSPGKFEVFLLHPSLLENLMCSRNLLKKSLLEKKNRYFSNILAARRLLLYIYLDFCSKDIWPVNKV